MADLGSTKVFGDLTVTGDIEGTASAADKLATARTIALSGDVTGSTTFDGSGNVSITATVASAGGTFDGGTVANATTFQSHVTIGDGHTIAGGSGHFAAGSGNYVGGPSADYSIAMGAFTTASGDTSTAMGVFTTASGNFSTAMGMFTNAWGETSTAMGSNTIADGKASTAMGESTAASGCGSTAMGAFTTASANFSTSMGMFTNASGCGSTAMGNCTTACGNFSTAMGSNTIACGASSLVMGFNSSNFCPTNSSQHSLIMQYNAPKILLCAPNGVGYFDGGTSSSVGADYAEYFESANGTCLERGHFVSFAEGSSCICYGNTELLGIVSADPAIVGDTQSFQYQGMYKKDEFKVYIKEWQESTEEKELHIEKSEFEETLTNVDINENGIKKSEFEEVNTYVFNPEDVINEIDMDDVVKFSVLIKDTAGNTIDEFTTLEEIVRTEYDFEVTATLSKTVKFYDRVKEDTYDESLKYLPRSERPEWSPIGLLGKLWVYLADGEVVTVGDYVTADTTGKAVKCLGTEPKSFRVIETNPEFNLVKIFFK